MQSNKEWLNIMQDNKESDTTKQAAMGLWSRDVSTVVMIKTHEDMDELLYDICDFEDVNSQSSKIITDRTRTLFKEQGLLNNLHKDSRVSGVSWSVAREEDLVKTVPVICSGPIGLCMPHTGMYSPRHLTSESSTEGCEQFTVHPTEIRTSISPSLVVWFNTTGALANYATEAGSIDKEVQESLGLKLWESESGLYVSLKTFLGFGREYVELYHQQTGDSVFLHIRREKKEMCIHPILLHSSGVATEERLEQSPKLNRSRALQT
uniref:Ubiquitinyl hydrolase variant UBP zinc finger domain-containing protein n=1 Tax=Timema bartmani TaxID=61472 RepID=A0A7R9I321_9NEOP|nr:unnamed protein product [Timema bartmani]